MKISLFGYSLKSQLVLIIPLITIGMWLIITIHNLGVIERSIDDISVKEVDLWINTYIEQLLDDIQSGNYSRLRRTARGVVDGKILGSLRIYDRRNEIIFSSESEDYGNAVKRISETDNAKTSSARREIKIQDRYGTMWGRVEVGMPKKEYQGMLQAQMYKSLMFGFGVLLIEIAILIFITNRMFHPLEKITGAIQRIREDLPNLNTNIGQFRDTVIMNQNDEISILGQNVYVFLDRIRGYTNDIAQLSTLAAIGRVSSQVAHDMRGPLSVFKNLVEVLRDDRLTKDEMGELTESAARSMAKLNNMAEDLLDYSKAQQVNRSNVAVDDAVKEVLNEVAAEAKALNVAVSYKKDVGIYASVDAGKLNRVLANMIINAIQAHDRPGHVMVEAVIDGENLAFVISDSGKGIPEDKMERIFDRSFTFGKPKGTGLGLAYCKQVVEAHGGKIEVQSKEGKGSVFTVCLPRCVGENVEASRRPAETEVIALPPEPLPRPVTIAERSGKNKKSAKAGNVLIADDDFGIRLQWIKIVQRLGGTIVCAASSPDELMRAGEFDYSGIDTAIVDYQYEGHDKTGIDLIEHLKKNGVEKIHLCTGHFGDTDVQKRAAEAGAVSVLAKPIDESEAKKVLC